MPFALLVTGEQGLILCREGTSAVRTQSGAQGEAGFTLVEVMVTCVIIGIATTLAVPNFLEWQARNKLRHATSEVASQLTLARMNAMSRNRSVNVTLKNVGDVVKITAVTASGSIPVESEAMLSKGIVMRESSRVVSFSSMGMRTSDGTQTVKIGVCNPQKLQYSVVITPVGKVNWATTAADSTPCP